MSEVAKFVGVSLTTVYVIKKRMNNGKVSTDVQAVVERLLWIVTACGMSLEALPRRPCTNMQGDLGERRLRDELSLSLGQRPVSLWKDAHACYPRLAP